MTTIPELGLLAGWYSGELAEPIPQWWPGAGLLPALQASVDRSGERLRIDAVRRGKLPPLFAHFGIDPAAPDAWESLALSLAVLHVPGFGVGYRPPPDGPLGFGLPFIPAKRGRGRPPKHPRGLLHELTKGAPKRPAHRPAMFTLQQKHEFVNGFDKATSEARARPGGPKTLRAAAVELFGDLAEQAMRDARRFRRELDCAKKSEKSRQAGRDLARFWHSP